MNPIVDVFRAYREATGCELALWSAEAGDHLVVEASTDGAAAPPALIDLPGPQAPPAELPTPGGVALVAALPGARRAWLAVGPCGESAHPLSIHLKLVLPVSAQYFQSSLEVEHAANELAERYEEINLLYTINEILGRSVDIEDAVREILGELSDTVGARRAAILAYDRATSTLAALATVGTPAGELPVIPVDDETSLSARVFRTLHPVIVENGDGMAPAETPFRKGATLSVPMMFTSGTHSEPLGVVTLSDRRSGQPFSAGDMKLVAAIATQIGTAIQNSRLLRQSLERERFAHEMQLAHDLQMRLLPAPTAVAPVATVAARVVPAESVGGDFYNLMPLGGDRAGVMVGDVSGHGYGAALIMALTMSASAIHAQGSADPGETLGALRASLEDELETTEMYMSLFYAVVDRARKTIHFANAGHPHAFVVRASGEVERLEASDPPLGMVPRAPATQRTTWDPAGDLLLLFTDGVTDARDIGGARLDEQPVIDVVVRHRADAPDAILRRIFTLVEGHSAGSPRRDDLTVVLLRG